MDRLGLDGRSVCSKVTESLASLNADGAQDKLASDTERRFISQAEDEGM